MLIDKPEVDMTIRTAGAIAFKNYIKRNWGRPVDFPDEPDRIHESDREAIKRMIVPMMLKSPVAIQKQFSDAIQIIGKYDFPKKWPQLIDDMIEKFQTGDFHIINGILKTAHSIFKRYRYEFKSQALWEEIKLVLDKFAKPLTDLLLVSHVQEFIECFSNSCAILGHFESHRHPCQQRGSAQNHLRIIGAHVQSLPLLELARSSGVFRRQHADLDDGLPPASRERRSLPQDQRR